VGAAIITLYLGGYSESGIVTGIGLASASPQGLLTSRILAEVRNPSFLALSADARVLYAVSEAWEGHVTAFDRQPDGSLRPLGGASTYGAHPCHLIVAPGGRHLLTANYSSGTVVVHPIGPDGALGEACDLVRYTGSGPDLQRQATAHPHMVACHDDRIFVVDLGTDTVHIGRLEPKGKLLGLSQLVMSRGAGPRHLAFHPDGSTAYVVNELNSTLSVCAYRDGALTLIEEHLTRSPSATGENDPAEVLVSGDGRFVYVTNRGDNTIGVFEGDATGRSLRLKQTADCGGNWPRHAAFGVDRRTLYVANQRSSTVNVLDIDPRRGTLSPSRTTSLNWPAATCVLPAPNI
jgi:6-phosphogluconolactonase